MTRSMLCWLLTIVVLSPVIVSAEDLGPANGALVIVGGGGMGKAIINEFIDRAGGREVPFVVIPTANVGEEWGEKYVARSFLTKAGAKDVTVVHTRDRAIADSEEFVAPIRRAKAVWIDGGRQWRLADSYLGTRTLQEIKAVLERGGVIGGSSAGATIQGSYLVRGAPEGNHIMMAKGHEEGFGLLKKSAIDQHVIARKRQKDLIPVIDAHPELLGIGIDEGTAAVVTGNQLRVIGASKVLLYTKELPVDGEPYHSLSAGDVFDLARRVITRSPSESP